MSREWGAILPSGGTRLGAEAPRGHTGVDREHQPHPGAVPVPVPAERGCSWGIFEGGFRAAARQPRALWAPPLRDGNEKTKAERAACTAKRINATRCSWERTPASWCGSGREG